MSWYIVDVEANGPAPGLFSLVSIGAVKLTEKLDQTFFMEAAPITMSYEKSAYNAIGVTYEEHFKYPDPEIGIKAFAGWIQNTNTKGAPILLSDNNGFDAAYVNYYFIKYLGRNPFGWSSRRIGDLYCGHKNDLRARWRHLRKTKHTHNPVDDAMGNAEALLAMRDMGLKIPIEQ